MTNKKLLTASIIAALFAIPTGILTISGDIGVAAQLNRIQGTNGDDIIFGTAGNDKIATFDGRDTIYPGDGEDQVNAGKGDDHINLLHDGKSDVINCGPGNDDVFNNGEGIEPLDVFHNCEILEGP